MHFAVAAAIRAIDPVVDAPGQPVHPQLLISLAEAREQHVSLVGLAIAVVVLEKPDVRRRRDQRTAPPGQDTCGKRKLIGKHSHAFVPAIAVAVLQEPDTSSGWSGRIVSHFDDVHPAICIPGDANRADHVRFGSDQLGSEVGIGEAKRLSFPGRRERAVGCGRARSADQNSGKQM